MGNKIVQQYDISWSYLILGKEALAQINTNINIQALNPNIKLNIKPWHITEKKLMFFSMKKLLTSNLT